MFFREGIPFILLEVWNLELVGYLDIRYQTEIISGFPKYFLPTEGSHFPLHFIIFLQ